MTPSLVCTHQHLYKPSPLWLPRRQTRCQGHRKGESQKQEVRTEICLMYPCLSLTECCWRLQFRRLSPTEGAGKTSEKSKGFLCPGDLAPGPCSSCSGKCPGGVKLRADFAGTRSQDPRHTEHSCESHTREVAGNKGLQTDRLNPFKFSFSLPSPFPLALIRALPPPPLSPKCLSAVSHPSGPWAERVIPPLCCSQRIKPAVLFLLHSLFPPNTCWAVERGYPQLVVPVETHVTLLLCLPRCSQGPPCWEALGEWEKS